MSRAAHILWKSRKWILRRKYSFFFQAEDGIRDSSGTGVQTCALPIMGTRKFSSLKLQSNTAGPMRLKLCFIAHELLDRFGVYRYARAITDLFKVLKAFLPKASNAMLLDRMTLSQAQLTAPCDEAG